MGTESKNVPASWKQMISIDKKPSFLLTNICLYNLYLLALKLLNTRGEMLYFELKLTQSKTTEWLSISLVAHQEGGFSLFHLFGVVSGTFQRCSIFYKHRRHRISLTCKFAMNQLHEGFITNDCKRHYKVGQLNPLSANLTWWSDRNNSSAICRRIVWVCLTILWY